MSNITEIKISALNAICSFNIKDFLHTVIHFRHSTLLRFLLLLRKFNFCYVKCTFGVLQKYDTSTV
jgi:hypothetical protein